MATATLDAPGGAAVPATGATLDRLADVRVPRRRARKIVIGGLVTLVLGVEIALAAPYLSGAMAAVIQAADGWVGLAMLAAAGSLTAFALVRRRLLHAAGIRVTTAASLASILVANAFHMTLPGGVAFSTGYAFRWMRQHGAATTVAGWSLAINGLLSTAGLTGLGLAASLLTGTTSWVRLVVEIAGIAVLVLGVGHVVRHPARVVSAAGRLLEAVNRFRRRPLDTGRSRLVETVAQLKLVRPSGRDWTAAAVFAVLNWVLDLVCLVACTHAVGLTGLPPTVLLTAYVAGMAASSLSLLPGGLGVVDAALVLGLVAGGAPAAAAVSAVVLYRLISLVGVVATGWAVHVVQQFTERPSSAALSLATR